MSRSSDRRDQHKPKPQQPAPGQRQSPKPGDWVNDLLRQIQGRKK